MSAQATLDALFQVTARDRDVLRAGKIPGPIAAQLRSFSRFSWSRTLPLLVLALLVGGIALGMLVPRPGERQKLAFALIATLFAALALMTWIWVRDLLHEAAVLRSRPALRVVEGIATTVRTWQYGYGDCYQLWAALEFADSDQSVDLHMKLGSYVISGWARVYIATIPSRKLGLAPHFEAPIALELGDDSELVQREPGKPPPEEPLRVDVPAD